MAIDNNLKVGDLLYGGCTDPKGGSGYCGKHCDGLEGTTGWSGGVVEWSIL